MRLLEKLELERDGTVTITDERNIVQLEKLVAHASSIGRGHVDVHVPIRPSQASRLTAIGGGRYVTLRSVSRVIVT